MDVEELQEEMTAKETGSPFSFFLLYDTPGRCF